MTDFTATRIAPGVTRITDVGQVSMVLVEGIDWALLIDTGYGYGDLNAFVRSLTSLPIEVVCTHGHVDHAGGAFGFGQVWLNEADWELAKEHTLPKTRADYLRNFGVTDSSRLLPAPVKPWAPLQPFQEFALGGCTVTAIPVSGHTPGTMAMLIEPQRIMLLGDACNSATFLLFDHSSTVEFYRNSLLELRRWDNRYDTVLFSHAHNHGGKEVVEQAISLCDAILEGTDDKMPVDLYAPAPIYAGKRFNTDFVCLDGTTANIWYDGRKIR